ncbi:MAG: hypothetical protein KG003_10515 [Bacteroidetes bacterium]|nr:hypothetical protein [Bacteroidota bacterium]
MIQNRTHIAIVLGIATLVSVMLIRSLWLSSTAEPAKSANRPMAGVTGIHKPVSREEFLDEIFKEVRPTDFVARNIRISPEKVSEDTLRALWKWSAESGIEPLSATLEADIAEKNPTQDNITSAARNLVFGGAEFRDYPLISDYLMQRGKTLIDRGMEMNPNNVPLRNALITYISEYENEPMKFLGVLRETLAIDSNNVETHFIHLGLLRKSGQWKKAVAKCEKLISLQPQNPVWLFQLSDIYGQMGDRENSKTYRDLAIKAERNQKNK